MTKRPPLRSIAPPADEAAKAAATARELQRRQGAGAQEERTPMTTSTFHIPSELLEALQQAALRRAARRRRQDRKGRGGRPSASEILVELLEKHRAELDKMG